MRNRATPHVILGTLFAASIALGSAGSFLPAKAENREAYNVQTPFYHYKQAQYFERQGQPDKAESELRQSMALAPGDYLNYVKLAALLSQEGRTNEAISLYKKAMTLDAQDPMLHFSLGALYEQTGQYAIAEKEYRAGLAKNPPYHFGYYTLARVQMQQGHYADAEDNFRKFLADYPDHYEAHKYLANVYLVNHQDALAAQEYEAMKAHFPDRFNDALNYARALTRSDAPQQALEELKSAYAAEGNKADILEEMGNAHIALRQPNYAIQNYQKSYDLDNKRYPLLLKIAEIQQNNRQPEQTIQTLNRFLTQDPDNTSVRHWLATTEISQKHYDQSLQQFEQLLNAAKTDTERYDIEKEEAYVYQLKGDLGQAIPRYESLLKRPDAQADTQLKHNLALAYHQAGRLEEAVPLYKSVYSAMPQNTPDDKRARNTLANDLANAMVGLGDAEYRNHRYDESLLKYNEAARYAPADNIAPYLGLGNAYFALNLYDQANDAYQKVLAKEPNHPTARLSVAKLKLQQQNPTASIDILQKLAAETPNNAEILLALGDAYTANGNARQALDAYQRAEGQLQTKPSAQVTPTALTPGIPASPVSIADQTHVNQTQQPTVVLTPDQRENLWMTEGALHQQLHEFTNAKTVYEKLLAAQPAPSPANAAKAEYNLGIVYNELGQLDQSAQAYRQALTLDPGFVDAHYGLAVTLEKQQKYQDALNAYEAYTQTPTAQYLPQAEQRIQLLKQALTSTNKASTPATGAPNTPGMPPETTPAGTQ